MLSAIKTITCSVLLLPPVSFLQSAPQPGLLKITSNPIGATITISVLDKSGNVDKNTKPVAAIANVSLVVTPGNYQVTAQSGSKSLKCSPTPANVYAGQTTQVVCN